MAEEGNAEYFTEKDAENDWISSRLPCEWFTIASQAETLGGELDGGDEDSDV